MVHLSQCCHDDDAAIVLICSLSLTFWSGGRPISKQSSAKRNVPIQFRKSSRPNKNRSDHVTVSRPTEQWVWPMKLFFFLLKIIRSLQNEMLAATAHRPRLRVVSANGKLVFPFGRTIGRQRLWTNKCEVRIYLDSRQFTLQARCINGGSYLWQNTGNRFTGADSSSGRKPMHEGQSQRTACNGLKWVTGAIKPLSM